MTNEEIEIVARALETHLKAGDAILYETDDLAFVPVDGPLNLLEFARLAITSLDQYREGKDQKRPYTREDYDAAPVDGWRHKP